jgi:fructose-1,6-bisphosphatase/sedoheptulose 1,7-bisphosphatase-like protein
MALTANQKAVLNRLIADQRQAIARARDTALARIAVIEREVARHQAVIADVERRIPPLKERVTHITSGKVHSILRTQIDAAFVERAGSDSTIAVLHAEGTVLRINLQDCAERDADLVAIINELNAPDSGDRHG